MFTLRRFMMAALPSCVIGAVLGCVISFLQMSTHLPADPFDQSVVIPFQNFAIAVGIGAGVIFGLAGAALFLVLLRRFRFPASTGLGTRLGFADGLLLCLTTSLIINATATSFEFLPSVYYVWISNTLIGMAACGVAGLVSGFLMAEIGGRNIR